MNVSGQQLLLWLMAHVFDNSIYGVYYVNNHAFALVSFSKQLCLI